MTLRGLMMDYQLTLPAILRRAETLSRSKEVVSWRPDRTLRRYTYGDMAQRARRLAVALQRLGIQPGDRVATLCWNHHQHLEAYFGIPAMGGVLHTLNLRLHPNDLAYIINHAQDRALIVDDVLLPLLAHFRDRVGLEHVIVVSDGGAVPEGTIDYERLLAEADEADYRDLDLDERQAAALCYTSGTTGRPKGVLYSHRALVLHSMAGAMADCLGVMESDVVCPVVPMFHVNAWGLPYTAALVGA
ncbi:MAG: AMP-binding protein, partial [Thermomicrobiaceae bacterium]|nr:AMP-binding protein [Thermomicrobiaceae bacterium]